MTFREKLVAQHMPTGSNPVVLTTGSNLNTIVRFLTVCNLQTGVNNTFSVYYSPNSSTYTVGNALYYDLPFAGAGTVELATYIIMQTGSTLGVQCNSNTGSRITFTAFGADP